MPNAIAGGRATRPTVTPAIRSERKVLREYPGSTSSNVGCKYDRGMEPNRRRARELAAESRRAGDPTGWFEQLYQEHEQGRRGVPGRAGVPTSTVRNAGGGAG